MGGFMSTLLSGNHASDVFIDFENSSPTSSESKVFESMQKMLSEGEDLVEKIKTYQGCQVQQQRAMKNETPNAEEECFEALLVNVALINDFYLFARALEQKFPILLKAVCTADEEGKEALSNKQALVTQVAKVLSFTLRFDGRRMMTAVLSNDFAYYRRLLPKFQDSQFDIVVGDDEASTMAMFTAEHQPMIVAVTKATVNAQKKNPELLAMPGLAVLANSCRAMVDAKRFSDEKINLLCAEAMAGAIVLYDRAQKTHPDTGVFHKKCPIKLKACINQLKRRFPDQHGLRNVIQFSTLNFRNAPSSITNLFD